MAGSSCGVCGARDPRVLRRVRLADGSAAVLCANEAAILGRRALTLTELRAEVGPVVGDRRGGADRRRVPVWVEQDRRRTG